MPDRDDTARALSADIHLLGDLLGEIIREQHGDEALGLVEQVRLAAKRRRNGDEEAAAELRRIVEGEDLASLRVLIKAFSIYFQLINIAEDEQRLRVLRNREATRVLHESLEEAIRSLAAGGLSARGMRDLLDRLHVRLVLTAHPTEAKRKEVLVKLRDIADMLDELDRADLLPRERAAAEARMAEKVEELWQTRPTRASRPTVADEVDFGLYFLTSVIMDIAVGIHDELRQLLGQVYPGEDWSELPVVLQYASWVGSDRDGNPNVTPQTTLDTLDTLHGAVRDVYLDELGRLGEHLTQSAGETGVSQALRDSVADSPAAARYPGEIYRQKIEQIRARLGAGGYRTGDDLLADLRLVNRADPVPLDGVCHILKIGRSRVIVPTGRRWDDLFANGPRVSDDFMVEREQPVAEERESF